MKRFWLSIMAVLLITAAAVPAFAWEFSMTGEFELRLRYFSRTGSQDLFGDASIQEVLPATALGGQVTPLVGGAIPGTGSPLGMDIGVINNNAQYVGFAGPNIYGTGWSRHMTVGAGILSPGATSTDSPVLGDTAGAAKVAITRGGFSRTGSDALYNDQKLTFNPSIRVNNAIRVHGVYTVGGFRHKYAQNQYDAVGNVALGVPPFERYYMSQTSDAAYNTAAIGSWEQVRATIQVPWGTWSIGVKDFPFGTGATLANNTRAEAFLTVVPYGPFRFLHGIWLARGSKGGAASWYTVPDKDSKADIFQGLLLTYDQGPLHLGAGWIYQFNHANRAYGAYDGVVTFGGLANVSNPALGPAWAYDQNFNQFLAYSKYFNGRFFANLEYYWLTNDTTFIGHYPTFGEGYHWYSDAGVVAGPAKVTAMFGISSGAVLNNNNITKKYVAAPINYQVLEPFSYLMFPIYGGGNNTFNADGNGEMSDAMALAGRLDYAVAANLNLFGSFIYAKRLERASTWAGGIISSNTLAGGNPSGMTSPSSALRTYAVNVGFAQAWKAVNGGGVAASTNPYVDDDLIGWEARGGLNWKLLEGFSMNAAYSYWQPGAWFDQAYRAFTSSNAGLMGDGLMVGRSAIHSVNGAMVIDF